MSKITIVNDGEIGVVMIDNETVNFDFEDLISSDIWAVQWNSTSGEIEYKDGKINEPITSLSRFKPLLDKASQLINEPSDVDDDDLPVESDVKIVTKLKLKRKLEEIGLWESLRALMVSNETIWDEWLISQYIDIEDPSTKTMYEAMGWSKEQLQSLFNDIGL